LKLKQIGTFLASITEILTLVVIIIGIIILPRMFKQEQKSPGKKKLSINSVSVPARFGIILSILIPIVSALYYQPWNNGFVMFILTGIIPLIAGWGLYWTFSGFKKTQ